MHKLDRALVLGPGGRIGTAWMGGLARGLRGAGVDLGEADLIVDTSAGAIVVAMIATGQDLERLLSPTRPQGPRQRRDTSPLGAVFAVLGEPGQEPVEARRRVGRMALDHADPDAEQALPPVAVGGRHYMDGALRSGANAGLAAGARTLVVLEPMARQAPQ